LKAIQASAKKRQIPVKLSVDRQNLLAKKLYLCLGFQPAGMTDTHEAMMWSPSVGPFAKDGRFHAINYIKNK
jgi:hypothetical protein